MLIIVVNFAVTESTSASETTMAQDYVETTPIRQMFTTKAQDVNSKLARLCSGNCSSLPASCYNCTTNNNCTYGSFVDFKCRVVDGINCTGEKTMLKKFQCRYCFLTKPDEEHSCLQTITTCKVTATPRQRVKGNCTVNEDVFCLGHRTFRKMMPCSWTSGYSWSTALALSITVGGFGADRFYLGHWREGLGKFFSFGGLGVWTLIDAILIGSGYLGPADGSLYVY